MTSPHDQQPDLWKTPAPPPPLGPYAQQPHAQPHQYGQPQPYGQQPYGHQPRGTVRPGRTLAVAALVLGGLYLLTVWVGAVAAFPAAETYREAGLRGQDAADVLTGYDLVAFVVGLALIAAWVLTCCWMMRAREGSEAISPHQPTRARGWIWAGWLVPVVSLWFPFQIVRDVWRTTRTAGGALLGCWWAAWLIGQGLQNVAGRLIPLSGPADPDLVVLLGPVELLSAAVLSVAFGLWCTIVLRIVRDQDAARR